jgi:hypothetical protein
MEHHGNVASLLRLLEQVATLLKTPNLGFELGRRGINTSIALVATEGLIAYLEGNARRAGEDLGTAAEEIAARLARR